jgi:hypothetical protein
MIRQQAGQGVIFQGKKSLDLAAGLEQFSHFTASDKTELPLGERGLQGPDRR